MTHHHPTRFSFRVHEEMTSGVNSKDAQPQASALRPTLLSDNPYKDALKIDFSYIYFTIHSSSAHLSNSKTVQISHHPDQHPRIDPKPSSRTVGES